MPCAIIRAIGASTTCWLLPGNSTSNAGNNGGSHHLFGFPNVEMDVTVPAHRPIKPVYIRQFLLLVDAVKELKK